MVAEQADDQLVIETHPAQKHVRARHLEHLSRRQVGQDFGQLLADAQTKHGRGLVLADHVLRQHQIGKIEFLDFSQHLRRVHIRILRWFQFNCLFASGTIAF